MSLQTPRGSRVHCHGGVISPHSSLSGELSAVKSLQATAYIIMYKETKSHVSQSWQTTKCWRKQKKLGSGLFVYFFFASEAEAKVMRQYCK